MGTVAIGTALPEIQAVGTSETGLRSPATTRSPLMRLDDQALAQLTHLANSPLPAAVPCAEAEFAKLMRTMSTMASRADDETTGKLRLAVLRRVVGHYPREAIAYLVETAITTLDWFPSPKQCLDILKGWTRNDEAVQRQASAIKLVRAERQARFDEVLGALERRELDQAAIDALSPRMRIVGAERGFLRLEDDGVYRARVVPCGTKGDSIDGAQVV